MLDWISGVSGDASGGSGAVNNALETLNTAVTTIASVEARVPPASVLVSPILDCFGCFFLFNPSPSGHIFTSYI